MECLFNPVLIADYLGITCILLPYVGLSRYTFLCSSSADNGSHLMLDFSKAEEKIRPSTQLSEFPIGLYFSSFL